MCVFFLHRISLHVCDAGLVFCFSFICFTSSKEIISRNSNTSSLVEKEIGVNMSNNKLIVTKREFLYDL